MRRPAGCNEPGAFIRLTLTAFSKTPKLYECTQASLLGALLMAAQLGMEPNSPLGQAYLIPYYNRDKAAYECQFQLGYKGMINLAYRSGKVTDIAAYEVRANDRFDYELGLESKLYHKPALRDRGVSDRLLMRCGTRKTAATGSLS